MTGGTLRAAGLLDHGAGHLLGDRSRRRFARGDRRLGLDRIVGVLRERLREDEPARRGLQGVAHQDHDRLADPCGAFLDHHHRAVGHEADALAGILAGLDDRDREAIARRHAGAQRAREVVEVEGRDALDLADLLEVRVGRADAESLEPAELEQLVVDGDAFDDALLDRDVEVRVGLQAPDRVEPAAAAASLGAIAAVGERLQFVDHELRHEERRVEEAGVAELVDAAVDEHRGVEDERQHAAGLPRELDVGDDEAEVVLGREHHRHAQVAEDDADHRLGELQVDRRRTPLEFPCPRDLIDERADRERADQPEADAEIDRDHGGEPLVRRDRVGEHDDEAQRRRRHQQPHEGRGSEVARGRLAREGEQRHHHEQDHEEQADREDQHPVLPPPRTSPAFTGRPGRRAGGFFRGHAGHGRILRSVVGGS